MTLDLVVQQPGYWIILIALLVGAKFAMRVRATDFRMIAVLTLSQFVAHSAVATGASAITYFCAAFWLCFVLPTAILGVISALRLPAEPMRPALPEPQLRHDTRDILWVTAARVFLTVYWTAHLVLLPPNFGVVAVDERLSQQASDKLLTFTTSLVLPALAACMWVWLQRGYRMRWWDFVPLGLSLVGMLGSTSKVNLLPVILAFLGVVALRRKPWREMRAALVLAAIAMVALIVRLVLYFPGGNFAVAAQTIAFRFAATTDSIDYLVRGHLAPMDYPFAGPAALLPFITKRLGYHYTYSPGVWLYGEVRGDFSGYGPNPGIVMDYFANLGWFALIVPVLLSFAAFAVARRPSAMSASLLAVLWFACSDVQLFELALVPQLLLIGALMLGVRLLGTGRGLPAVNRWLGRTTRPAVGRRRVSALRRRSSSIRRRLMSDRRTRSAVASSTPTSASSDAERATAVRSRTPNRARKDQQELWHSNSTHS